MTAKKLYERDFYAGTQETARLLRERRFGDVDLANLIEEVETLGRSERIFISPARNSSSA
ncbi:hypothetical protein MAMT_00107 [Methylacidimicrobium tartarophylax]|uniref:Uncharacterized protein n=1 Tax=Methylacidimicrobium tartarophylax TaxID=1041768 RepID=A0A5E6M549_9BACT|nr:DUF29 family protein [Methylacidimicrobium tartarophylax]VVM04474.1 hypothetical protein MAMT_00107 [Methylacidimicrobium tartarophylax]